MTDYISKPYTYKDKACYIVEPVVTEGEKPLFSIVCDDSTKVHNLKISLLLETTPTPMVAPELYDFSHEEDGVKFYIAKEIAMGTDDGDDINSCCQSGCKGCPTFKGFY